MAEAVALFPQWPSASMNFTANAAAIPTAAEVAGATILLEWASISVLSKTTVLGRISSHLDATNVYYSPQTAHTKILYRLSIMA
jgi:hypothetical protein